MKDHDGLSSCVKFKKKKKTCGVQLNLYLHTNDNWKLHVHLCLCIGSVTVIIFVSQNLDDHNKQMQYLQTATAVVIIKRSWKPTVPYTGCFQKN